MLAAAAAATAAAGNAGMMNVGNMGNINVAGHVGMMNMVANNTSVNTGMRLNAATISPHDGTNNLLPQQQQQQPHSMAATGFMGGVPAANSNHIGGLGTLHLPTHAAGQLSNVLVLK